MFVWQSLSKMWFIDPHEGQIVFEGTFIYAVIIAVTLAIVLLCASVLLCSIFRLYFDILDLISSCLYMLPVGSIKTTATTKIHISISYWPHAVVLSIEIGWSILFEVSTLEDVKYWIAKSFLMVNESELKVLIFGIKDFCCSLNNILTPPVSQCKHSCKEFKCQIWFQLKIAQTYQLDQLDSTGIFHFVSTAKLKSFLSFRELEIIVYALIPSCLDYCNYFYVGVSQCAVCPKCSSKRWEHTSSQLAYLHWLPNTELIFRLFYFSLKHWEDWQQFIL